MHPFTYFRTLLFIVACFFAGICQAQNAISISGHVISAEDHQPVPYANIGINGRGIGTATNQAGDFLLNIPAGLNNDSLRISCLGFKTQSMALSTVKSGQSLTITMVKTAVALKEVKIQAIDAAAIIRKAIERVPQNYINHPLITEGFYRNSTTKNNTHLQLSEAVFDIYNAGYNDTKTESQLKLIKARDVKNQRDFKNIEVGWKASSVMSADIVKQIGTNDIFGKTGIQHHTFEVMGVVDYQDLQAYEISFKEKPGMDMMTYRGKVYIDTKTLAFLNFDYGLSPDGLKLVKIGSFTERMLMKMLKMDFKLTYDRVQISYQNLNGKWVLSGMKNDNSFLVNAPTLGYDFTAVEKFNYIVTRVDTAQAAPFDQKLSKNSRLEDYDTDPSDDFWKSYNIILPDFNSAEVIKSINVINDLQRLKGRFLERARKLPKDPALRIDSMLTFYRANNQFNGSALIKMNGKVILNKSYGYANLAQKQTADEHTTYRIGSLAKSFTSVIINQLMNEGKLDSLAPIRTYLPDYVHRELTIEQLLTHRTGIPEYLNNDDYKAKIFSNTFTLPQLVKNFCSDSLEFLPGTQFSYSNSNFVVLALIAQQVTGKPFETLLQERIFTPLQMADTFTGDPKPGSHQAIGYTTGSVPEMHYNAANVLGAGGISSSAADLLKFHNGLLADQLMPKDRKADMLKPRAAFTDYRAWYGYGWMTDKDWFPASRKHVITYHPGTDMGFFTMFVRQEDQDNCIILLNNTGEFPRYDLAEMILDILN